MRLRTPVLLVLLSILATIPAPAGMLSSHVWLEFGGAIADDGGGFHLIQIFSNTAEQPLWVTVRQGSGAGGCEVSAKIEPKKKETFRCSVRELKPGDVPVVV